VALAHGHDVRTDVGDEGRGGGASRRHPRRAASRRGARRHRRRSGRRGRRRRRSLDRAAGGGRALLPFRPGVVTTARRDLRARPPCRRPLGGAHRGGPSPQRRGGAPRGGGPRGRDGWPGRPPCPRARGRGRRRRDAAGASLECDGRRKRSRGGAGRTARRARRGARPCRRRALLDRIRQGALRDADRARADVALAQARAASALDPRARLVDLWRGDVPYALPSLDELRAFASATLHDDTFVIIAARPARIAGARR
jgi:hypothetical protein